LKTNASSSAWISFGFTSTIFEKMRFNKIQSGNQETMNSFS